MNKAMNLPVVAFAVMVATAPVVATAVDTSGAVVVTDSVFANVTVVDIKSKERELTLRDEKGNEVVVIAPEEVRNFAQIKKGDVVEVEYHRAAASTLEIASDTRVAEETTNIDRAPAGAKPGMHAMHTRAIVATVLDVDAKQRLLTVQGPQGGIVTVKVPAELKNFDSLKKGDKISAVYSEAVAVRVKTPAEKK